MLTNVNPLITTPKPRCGHSPSQSPLAPSSLLLHSCPHRHQRQPCSDFDHHRVILHILEVHIKGITQHVSFYIQLLPAHALEVNPHCHVSGLTPPHGWAVRTTMRWKYLVVFNTPDSDNIFRNASPSSVTYHRIIWFKHGYKITVVFHNTS